MSIKDRLAKLEMPFRKYPPVICVKDECEIDQAKKDWQVEHKRTIGKNEEVIIIIDNIPRPTTSENKNGENISS
jgi:hypothetical protein